jgi:hypothetical protein
MPPKYKNEPQIIVDLRPHFVPARDQGERPLCLVFAMSDLNSFTNQLLDALSAEYLAYRAYELCGQKDYTQGLTCDSVIQSLNIYGQPYEHIHPYSMLFRAPLKFVVQNEKIFTAKGFQQLVNVADIKNYLNNKIAITLIVNLTSEFYSPIAPYILDAQNDFVGMHAVVVVGYGELDDGQTAFLVRNSWGDSWANQGHAWITSSFCESRAKIFINLEK